MCPRRRRGVAKAGFRSQIQPCGRDSHESFIRGGKNGVNIEFVTFLRGCVDHCWLGMYMRGGVFSRTR
jgi:hypothetical protein